MEVSIFDFEKTKQSNGKFCPSVLSFSNVPWWCSAIAATCFRLVVIAMITILLFFFCFVFFVADHFASSGCPGYGGCGEPSSIL